MTFVVQIYLILQVLNQLRNKFSFAMLVQDIASKIMSFSQQGPRAVCILSANGAVSTVTLRQPATSGGTVTYEVYFWESFLLGGNWKLIAL